MCHLLLCVGRWQPQIGEDRPQEGARQSGARSHCARKFECSLALARTSMARLSTQSISPLLLFSLLTAAAQLYSHTLVVAVVVYARDFCLALPPL